MPEITVKGRKIKVDEGGFLLDPNKWDKDVGEFLAKRKGIKLTEEHWRVIEYLREYHKKFNSPPPCIQVCKGLNFENKCLLDLFSLDFKKAFRISGLPEISDWVG